MGMPALKIEPEIYMEERVARLEANVGHIQSDIVEIKTDIREIRSELKEFRSEFTSKLADLDQRLSARIDALKGSFAALNVSRMADRVWWLVMAAGLLAVMARGFKWI